MSVNSDPDPVFTVVITSFNKRSDILAAIASATGQGEGVEVIVVDDGSTDGSREVLAASAATVILHEQNKGAMQAYLTGLRAARGRHLVMLDGDDQLVPGILGRLAQSDLLDDVSCLRLGMAVKGTALPAPNPSQNLKVARVYRPGAMMPILQSTGGASFICPRKLFQRCDAALAGRWPEINAQDHFLHGALALLATRVVALREKSYIFDRTEDSTRLSRQNTRLHRDRLISDAMLATLASEPGPFHQGPVGRLLLRLGQSLRLRRHARGYGVASASLLALLFNDPRRSELTSQVIARIDQTRRAALATPR